MACNWSISERGRPSLCQQKKAWVGNPKDVPPKLSIYLHACTHLLNLSDQVGLDHQHRLQLVAKLHYFALALLQSRAQPPGFRTMAVLDVRHRRVQLALVLAVPVMQLLLLHSQVVLATRQLSGQLPQTKL